MRPGPTVLSLVLSVICVVANQPVWTQSVVSEGEQIPTITRSPINEDLETRKDQNPKITARELADYGNKLLAQKGVNYVFDICKFLERDGKQLRQIDTEFFQPFSVRLTTVSRESRNFQIAATEPQPLGACFTQIPASQVTSEEMTVIVDGQPVRLQRPKDFTLSKTEMVDRTMKRVVRRWELPFEGDPVGISPDGKRLYLRAVVNDFSSDAELALELSEDGALQFRARRELGLRTGKRLRNGYLRFLNRGRAFILKPSHTREFQVMLVTGMFTPPDPIYPIETKQLSQKNPTFYEFDHSLSEIREKILAFFDNPAKEFALMESFYGAFRPSNFGFSVETKENSSPRARKIFENPENKDDLFLSVQYDAIVSPIYFGGGKPLGYRPAFQLHFTDSGNNRTKVSVITHDPEVVNGQICCGLHGYKSNTVAVEPTTIEEYKILRFIGHLLGVSDMPPLRLPESN